MATRATIKFSDGDDAYFVYRGHDAFPETVLGDIEKTLAKANGRWSDPELGLLVTLFLSMGWDAEKFRLPDYEITPCFHGDESYRYHVTWDGDAWTYGKLEFTQDNE